MRYAINRGKYKFADPTVGIDLPKNTGPRKRYLTPEEIQKLLAALVKKPRLYYTCFVKLILLPLIIMAICLLLHTDPVISGVVILATACPTAAISTMFAIRFGKNAGYSAEIFAMTTLISMLTLPAVLMLYEALCKII